LRGTSNLSGISGVCGPIATALPVGQWIELILTVTGSGNDVHIRTFASGMAIHDCMTTAGTIGNGPAGVISFGTDTIGRYDDFSVSLP
jgi:hypothetical protein